VNLQQPDLDEKPEIEDMVDRRGGQQQRRRREQSPQIGRQLIAHPHRLRGRVLGVL
jgi:hypothetical protein